MKEDHIEYKLEKTAITWGGNIVLSSTILKPHMIDSKIQQLTAGTSMLSDDRRRVIGIKIVGNKFHINYETTDGNIEVKNDIEIMIEDAEWLCEIILTMLAQENKNKLL